LDALGSRIVLLTNLAAFPKPTVAGFTSIDPAVSKVTFANHVPPARVVRNRNLTLGSGVAIGDFDSDGLADLFFASLSGTNTLYRNLGSWRFEDVSAAAGIPRLGWTSTGATFADLDGDRDLDLLVSTLGSGVQYFQNLGPGRFRLATIEAGLSASTGSTTLALGDVDGDADLDLYVVNYGAESVLASGGSAEVQRVNGEWIFSGPHAHRLRLVDGRVEEVGEAGVLFRNDGNGQFKPVPWNSEHFVGSDGRPKAPPLDYGLGAQMRDVNGDGAPDLYICNDFQMPDRLWINDGTGRFRESSFFAQRKFSFSSMGVDFGDLDRDGHLDFLVVEMASREHARAMRQVSGMTPFPHVPGRFEARPQVVRNTLFRSNGDGSWSEIAEFAGLAATDWSWQPVFLDADLDGLEDILIVNGTLFDLQDRDTLARIQSLGRQSPEVARTHLLRYPPFPSPNVAFRNQGAFAFEDVSRAWHFDSTRVSTGVALGDLDNDGDADVVVNCLNDGALLYRNDSTAPRLAIQLHGAGANTRGIGANLEVIGGPMIQRQEMIEGGRYLSDDDASRTFACGTATQLTVRIHWRSGHLSVVSNVPPNCLLSVSEPATSAASRRPPPPQPTPWFSPAPQLQHRHLEKAYDDYQRQPLLPKQLSSLGPGLAWVDLDGDGRDELVVGTGRGGSPGAFRFSIDGRATPIPCEWTAPDDVTGMTGWLTAEGQPGLLLATSGYENDSPGGATLWQISLNPAPGHLRVEPLRAITPFDAALGPVAAADCDGDGDLDLFVGARVVPGAYPRSGTSRLWIRGHTGQFSEHVGAAPFLQNAGMVSGALWTDLENDGFPELVVAPEWGPLRILRNRQGTFSAWNPPIARTDGAGAHSSQPLSEITGWWNAVTAGDFDGDGRLDLVAANWGLNTGYRASSLRPLHLYFGRYHGNSHEDLIESYFAPTIDRQVPRRSLNALRQAFPFLAARFPTHEAFGQASIEDLLATLPFPPAVLGATTLESMVFLNTSEGWLAHPLPPEAQYAPAFGLSVADADGDGHQDLFVAQNFFAMRIEWPRCDAGRGVWLHGDGTGRFHALSASASGIALPGEQRGAAIADFDADSRPDLAVAQNGTVTTLWRNTTAPPGIVVEVAGPPSNPKAYGVTVQGVSPSHQSPILENRASNGYWSVDSSRLILHGPQRPSELIVRWPGGSTKRIPIPPGASRMRLSP